MTQLYPALPKKVFSTHPKCTYGCGNSVVRTKTTCCRCLTAQYHQLRLKIPYVFSPEVYESLGVSQAKFFPSINSKTLSPTDSENRSLVANLWPVGSDIKYN